jgi:cbb3-type cytochrome oxidase subunit 1
MFINSSQCEGLYFPHAKLCPSTDLAQFHGTYLVFSALAQFSHIFSRISNFFGQSATGETIVVEMRIWCIKIGIVLVLHVCNFHGI